MNTTRTLKVTQAAKMMGITAKAAAGRLKALGYTVTCARCHGSGRHSYNQMDGDRCWGCDGRKVALAPLTVEIVTEAIARIAAGELDAYFAENRARNTLKAAADAAWATFRASPVCAAYDVGYKSNVDNLLDTPVGRAQSLQCAAIDWINSAQYSTQGASKRTALENMARVEFAHHVLRSVIAAWELANPAAT